MSQTSKKYDDMESATKLLMMKVDSFMEIRAIFIQTTKG